MVGKHDSKRQALWQMQEARRSHLPPQTQGFCLQEASGSHALLYLLRRPSSERFITGISFIIGKNISVRVVLIFLLHLFIYFMCAHVCHDTLVEVRGNW